MVRLPNLSVLAAALAAFAQIGCGSDKAAGPPPVAVDTAPPVIVHFLGPIEEAVQPGDIIELRFLASDAFGVKSATLNVHGAFEASVSGEFEGAPKVLEAYTLIFVPFGSSIEEPAIATLTVVDLAGYEAHAETRVYLRDTRPPFVRLDFGGLHFDDTIRPGETLDIYVNAEDNHRLRFIGYEGAGLRDSVAATSIGDSHTFRLTVPQSWQMQRPVLRAWARDASGNVSEPIAISRREVPVYDWVDHAITTIPVQREYGPLRVLWDAKRNAVYRLRGEPEGPNTSRIDGVIVSSGAPVPSMPLPAYPYDFAFSATGDSLVVNFANADPALGIVDLLPPVRSTSIVPLRYDSTVFRFPYRAHASGGRFFVALVHALYESRLLDVNFGTGTQVIRTDIVGGAQLAQDLSLLPLPDGRLVIGPSLSNALPEHRVIYSPTSDTFTPTSSLRPVSRRQYSASVSGRFMMGNTVYDAALDSVTTVATQDWDYVSAAAIALSPDGQVVYLATRYGYQKVRLSDGFLLEQVKLGVTPLYLFAVTDGSRLIAVSESSVMVIDLR